MEAISTTYIFNFRNLWNHILKREQDQENTKKLYYEEENEGRENSLVPNTFNYTYFYISSF
jgi:hypothetical protein